MSTAVEQGRGSPRRGEARTKAILEATIELLAEVLDALRSRGSMLPELSDSGTLRGDLEHYVRASVAATAGIAGSLLVGLLGVSTHDPELAGLLAQQLHHEQLPAITEVLDRARARGEVSPEIDPVLITEVLPGSLIMHLLVLGLPGDEAFIAGLVDDVLLPLLTADQRKPVKRPKRAKRA
jgi:hypothetical protein